MVVAYPVVGVVVRGCYRIISRYLDGTVFAFAHVKVEVVQFLIDVAECDCAAVVTAHEYLVSGIVADAVYGSTLKHAHRLQSVQSDEVKCK